jgi:hypothetical protein
MKGITIFDFDRSIVAQYAFLNYFRHLFTTRPMTGYQRSARLWSSERSFKKLSHSMQLENVNQFVLLGSGDYHHLTLALLAQHSSPLTLVLFDNHPDWMKPPHKYHCGSWIYTAARMPHVERIVIIGLENGDLVGKSFLAGDVESYLSHKIVLLPYLPIDARIQNEQPLVRLACQLKTNQEAGINEILEAIATPHVYISIDKDCLQSQDAITNWEQGTLPLDTVVTCIQRIAKSHTIVGADTVGDYSPPLFNSPLKWIGSVLDRPANALRIQSKKKSSEVNAMVNIKLAQALGLEPV